MHLILILVFQSPSLRGSGRFPAAFRSVNTTSRVFQSPSLRGSGRFAPARDAGASPGRVSIPFIAGQWSLPHPMDNEDKGIVFQSPSLRGSGRFPTASPTPSSCTATFQSPSLRGSGRFLQGGGKTTL